MRDMPFPDEHFGGVVDKVSIWRGSGQCEHFDGVDNASTLAG